VSHFVSECREEWKRLGVPRRVADDMAAELETDLQEAAAEGASIEDVLGPDAADPRSFALAWAGERGVIRSGNRRFGYAVAAAIALFAAAAIAGAVLLLTASQPTSTVLSPVEPPALASVRTQRVWVGPPLHAVAAPVPANVTEQPLGFQMITTDVSATGLDTQAVGLVLLVAGLAGLMPTLLLHRIARDR
jgi:hypothetical protein